MAMKTDFSKEELSTWDRIKEAFANDWEQTEADFGSGTARDMDRDLDDTVKQMAGSDDAFENREQAFRFGYTAQQRYKTKYTKWNDELDSQLRADYDGQKSYVDNGLGVNATRCGWR